MICETKSQLRGNFRPPTVTAVISNCNNASQADHKTDYCCYGKTITIIESDAFAGASDQTSSNHGHSDTHEKHKNQQIRWKIHLFNHRPRSEQRDVKPSKAFSTGIS